MKRHLRILRPDETIPDWSPDPVCHCEHGARDHDVEMHMRRYDSPCKLCKCKDFSPTGRVRRYFKKRA